MSVLFAAICLVESGGDASAYHKAEDAVGIVQIRPIMVEDVNRILKLRGDKRRFTLGDRWNVAKSKQMFYIYTGQYCKGMTLIDAARCWNGGPKGHKKDATLRYAAKVQAALRQIEAKASN
ncbi:MAG: hypothetical protein B6D36_01105 [Planctomycetes bacterium UTPLA1]|nr:MAG: hypothetical protein B6D36_01105 [Planctomycetes bacterium UTPLA1]